MTRTHIQEGYFKKFILLFVLLGFISLGAIGGCSDNNGGGQNNTQALTENDFATDTDLRGDPARGVLVTELEHPDSEAKENDTAGVGVDRIPLRYSNTVEQTFCWEDDDPDAMHFMELLDSEENVVMTVEANGDCVDQIIMPGEYLMSFNHDGRIDRAFAIFSDPVEPDSQQANQSDGLFDKFKKLSANLLNRIQNTVTEDAQAQGINENLIRLFYTNSCVGCDLSGVFISGWDLQGADLRDANLTRAEIFSTDLSDANLTNAEMISIELDQITLTAANLTGAILAEAEGFFINAENADFTNAFLFGAEIEIGIFNGANFADAGLSFALLPGANFTNANLEMAFLIETDLRFANLTDADLRNASLRGANLQGATLAGADFLNASWCNRDCRCQPPSIGECTGCPPAQEVCTGQFFN